MPDATYKDLKLFVPESLLSRLMDDRDLMLQVLEACLPDLRNNLERFREQLAAGDVKEARRTVHSIKGSAQNSDLRALAALTLEIEDSLKEGDEGFARAKVGELADVIENTIREIQGYFPELG
ncbi:Hpt domain-containing protein [Pelagicoccus sp. SDUM812005]|uniref:Hpt domain-containing protein n=1 Tax=Pelagicoccus sp. SDUM812005 TaxID=3041257 RepID=UPI00280CD70A|nr:Hpt domain-containing protein [Pelagicoccus sp. SDUM812005]MDQ8183226.1 Hpt domain-containing protein [Pelagicoccus sp. SDUM812005]